MPSEEISILDGSRFVVSDRHGDVDASPDEVPARADELPGRVSVGVQPTGVGDGGRSCSCARAVLGLEPDGDELRRRGAVGGNQ